MKRYSLGLVVVILLAALTGGTRSLWAATADLVVRAETLARALDEDGRDPQQGQSRDARADINRLRGFVPQLESYCARHPRDARALVALARLRSSQIQFEAVGASTGAPAIHPDQTGLDPVIPLLDSALVLEPRFAPAWFWKARLIGRPSFYRKEHRVESLSMIQPDNERALSPAARAVDLAPHHPIYRELYQSLLKATGRTDEEYRAHPNDDVPWRANGRGSLAGFEEKDWALVPLPPGAVLLSSSDLLGKTSAEPRAVERGVLQTRRYAVPGSANELERHFAASWPGFVWKPVTAEDLSGDPFGAMFAPALTDSAHGRVRLFSAVLEWGSESGRRVLQLPWGQSSDEATRARDGITLLTLELTGEAGGMRLGPLESIRTDPYCVLTLASLRALPR
jgi:hypothetical protein